jgi:flavodoxin
MKQPAILILLIFSILKVAGQTQQRLELNKEYKNVVVTKSASLVFTLQLSKNSIYQFSILQQGIAVYYALIGADDTKLYECNYPHDFVGYEKFEYSPSITGNAKLVVKRFEDQENPDSGQITIYVKSLNAKEIATRKQIKKELEPENNKNVQTIDIDHFWQAFDNLKNCKNFSDSAASFQRLYLDRATNGLLDFIQARELTAEKFVDAVSRNYKFYQSVRTNTYEAKQTEPVIEEVFERFKEIYPNFKPFKVCFAIGIKNTGGTVSNEYVLIGTEVTTATNEKSIDSKGIIQKIKSIVAHECVHTQQKLHPDSAAIKCELLYKALKEGACDFIGELVTGNPKNNVYGDKNERRLWDEFKNELCNQNIGNWLYNGSSVKGKPADLGYYVGYKIVEAYYKNAIDKKQAIVDIIEMVNPIQFLEQSKYDQKQKN